MAVNSAINFNFLLGYSHTSNFFFLVGYLKSPYLWIDDKTIVIFHIIFIHRRIKINFNFLYNMMLITCFCTRVQNIFPGSAVK